MFEFLSLHISEIQFLMSSSNFISTLTMNPCYDKSVIINDEIKIGGLNRTKTIKMELAGKGFNVSRGL